MDMITRSDIVRIGFKAIGIAFAIPGIYLLYLAAESFVHVIVNDRGISGLLGPAGFLLISMLPLIPAYMFLVKFSAKSIRLLCALLAFAGWVFINSEIQKIFDPRTFNTRDPMFAAYALIGLAAMLVAVILMIWLYKITSRLLIKWAAIDEIAEQGATPDRRDDQAQ
jgi:hypothetical protein